MATGPPVAEGSAASTARVKSASALSVLTLPFGEISTRMLPLGERH